MRRDPLDAQFPERAPQLCFSLRPRLFVLPARRQRRLKQAGFVGIDCLRPPVALHIAPQHPHVMFRRIGRDEARKQRAGRIIDQRDQIHLVRPALFQPRMYAGIPLHQFAAATAPRTPHVYLLILRGLRLPDAVPDHQLAQCLPADADAPPLQYSAASVGPKSRYPCFTASTALCSVSSSTPV